MTEAVPHWQRGVVALGAILEPAESTPRLIGSGFIIDTEAGIVVTCAHVVDDIQAKASFAHIAVGLGDPVQWRFRAEVQRHRPRTDLDLALLQLTANLEGAPLGVPIQGLAGPIEALPLGDSDHLQAAEPIVVLGYGQPEERNFRTQTATTTQGVFSGRLEDQRGRSLLKTDGLVLGGHSGGPALNRRGCVIGWNAMSARDAASLHPKLRDELQQQLRHQLEQVQLQIHQLQEQSEQQEELLQSQHRLQLRLQDLQRQPPNAAFVPSGLNLLRPINALLGEVAALLATLTPPRQGPSVRELLRGAISPGKYVLEQAVVALVTPVSCLGLEPPKRR